MALELAMVVGRSPSERSGGSSSESELAQLERVAELDEDPDQPPLQARVDPESDLAFLALSCVTSIGVFCFDLPDMHRAIGD